MKHTTKILLSLTILIAWAAAAAGASFELDKVHSSVEFKVRHLAISKVSGRFDTFDVNFDFEPGKPESWRAEATIDASSVNTGNEKRDKHLRSEDFLEAAKFPTLEFVSTGVQMHDEHNGILKGDLTLHGVTLPVELELEVRGIAEFMGTTKAGFTARGKINRKDFGLTWSKTLETGGLVVGDKVEIILEIEGNQIDTKVSSRGDS